MPLRAAPNLLSLRVGRRLLEPGAIEIKKPRFDTNPDFDLTVFGQTFDFVMADSIEDLDLDVLRALTAGLTSDSGPVV